MAGKNFPVHVAPGSRLWDNAHYPEGDFYLCQ